MRLIQASGRILLKIYDSGFLRKAYLLVGMVWAIPIGIIIRLISPFLKIRTGSLLSQYIGHYAGDTEIYICERSLNINVPSGKYVDLWFHANRVISNTQLEKMWRQKLTILPRFILAPIHKFNSLVPDGNKYIAKSTFHDRDVRNILDIQPPSLFFSEDEIVLGRETLLQMGVPDGQPFVCLLIREEAYHNTMQFTNYRNADVKNFIPALEKLTELGFYIVRMGKKVTSKLEINNTQIIDYAASPYRTDFMDIYLGAFCNFVISTSSGWDMVASNLFRRPILYTNMVPVSLMMTWTSRHTFLFKRHWSIQKKRYLTLSEIFDIIDKDYSSISPKFEERGVLLIENTALEIEKAVLELVGELEKEERLRNRLFSTKQLKFWEQFEANVIKHNLTRYHGKMKSKVSESFIESAPEFLL